MNSQADDPHTTTLLNRLQQGDRSAIDELLSHYRISLRGYIDRRLDNRIRSRVDPSDVIQEAFLEVARRIDDYLERRPMPFRLWVMKTAHEHLQRQRRKHREADCRDVDREQVLPEHSTQLLAGYLVAKSVSPSMKAQQTELHQRVKAALASLPEMDREILLLRIFEGFDNQEVAGILDLNPDAASKRYGRALIRLRACVGEIE